MGVQAFAQGRGRGGAGAATNDFYRFNYNEETMQPITYPSAPIATRCSVGLRPPTER